jgi:putative ABC transport system ATP-binding protein
MEETTNKIKKVKTSDLKSVEIFEVGKISIKDLVKVYKQGKVEVVALRGLKSTFYPGITCIMGPSGCGKTTLLNLIGGLDRATAGEIQVGKNDITKLTDKELDKFRRNNVGFVFQMFNLVPTLTGEENIDLPMTLLGKPKSERKSRINELLSLFKIEDRKEHRPDELSGGEQQRFAIASALANNPNIVLCDEPTGELDSKSREDFLEALKQLIKSYPNKIVIIATHDQNISKIADYLYIIEDGLITEELTKEHLKEFSKTTTAKPEITLEKVREFNKLKKDIEELSEKLKKFEM